jgi:hypothetical protein
MLEIKVRLQEVLLNYFWKIEMRSFKMPKLHKKGKMNEGALIAGAIIVAVLLLNNQGQAPAPVSNGGGNTGGGIDLCKLVDGQASFTGQDKFLSGTSRSTDWVRVIEINGDGMKRDIGQISMNSGSQGITPNHNYKLYFGENTTSTSRYTYLEEYTGPCQDATDNKVGYLCTVDTSPTTTVYDENGDVNTAENNAQAIGAGEIVDVSVKVKVAADQCYGNPQAPGKNAICFDYNSSIYSSVKGDTPGQDVPYSVSSGKTAGFGQECYELDKLSDTQSQIVNVKLTPLSGDTNPATTDGNVTVSLEDVAFDLNQDTLEEIWGFEDEDNNNLGQTSAVTDTIHVS